MIKKPFIKTLQDKFGIGNGRTKTIVNFCGLNPKTNAVNVKKKQLEDAEKLIVNLGLGVEKVVKNKVRDSIMFLKDHKTYRGVRHKLKYPVRGQRTHTNAKTTKKNKRIL